MQCSTHLVTVPFSDAIRCQCRVSPLSASLSVVATLKGGKEINNSCTRSRRPIGELCPGQPLAFARVVAVSSVAFTARSLVALYLSFRVRPRHNKSLRLQAARPIGAQTLSKWGARTETRPSTCTRIVARMTSSSSMLESSP